jgi:hypothetical protein
MICTDRLLLLAVGVAAALFAVTVGVQCGAANTPGRSAGTIVEDQKMQRARQLASHRQRRIIYNDDGSGVWGSGGKINDTPEAFLAQRMNPLIGSQVDSVFFNTVMWADRFSHVPGVGEFVTDSMLDSDPQSMRGLCIGFRKLADTGRDAMQITLDFCRENRMEFVWSYRVNDIHDAIEVGGLAKYKRENPQLLLGKPEDVAKGGQARWWTAFDFGREEVRKRQADIIRDVLTRYDLDGIDLDFCRTPIFFTNTMLGKPVEQRDADLMTGLVRDIRKEIVSASKRRGRPLLLSARVPETLERSHYVGMDVDKWLSEGLLDILVVGQGYVPLTAPVREFIELGHKHKVPVYPCICGSAKTLRVYGQKSEIWRAAASNYFRSGADGVMTFNLFPDQPSEILQTIGAPSSLSCLDKMFGIDLHYAGSDVDHVIPLEDTLPVTVQAGKTSFLKAFPVGDDLRSARRKGRLKSLELRVKMENLGDRVVELGLNRKPLKGVTRDGDWLVCSPPVSAVVRGLNRVRVRLEEDPQSPGKQVSVTDVQLWVRYSK